MKKMAYFLSFVALEFALASDATFAQEMMRARSADDDHTAREEAAGAAIAEQLQANNVRCVDLSSDDFGALGEYYMGRMMGDAHPAMNQMMTQMMGENGEEAMHVALGKRLSGCEPDAALPHGTSGFMPMMQMMGYGGVSMMRRSSLDNSWHWLIWLNLFVWLIVGILAIPTLVRLLKK